MAFFKIISNAAVVVINIIFNMQSLGFQEKDWLVMAFRCYLPRLTSWSMLSAKKKIIKKKKKYFGSSWFDHNVPYAVLFFCTSKPPSCYSIGRKPPSRYAALEMRQKSKFITVADGNW